MRISDWSSDVCSSDLAGSTSACTVFSGCTFDWVKPSEVVTPIPIGSNPVGRPGCGQVQREFSPRCERGDGTVMADGDHSFCRNDRPDYDDVAAGDPDALGYDRTAIETAACNRSEEHTSELQSLMRTSYAVF